MQEIVVPYKITCRWKSLKELIFILNKGVSKNILHDTTK